MYLLILLLFIGYFSGKGQQICVHCFEQNEPISTGVTNLLLNGGFENTTCIPGWLQDCFCPNSNLYNCDLASWTCTGGDDQSYSSVFDNTLSIIPEGQNAAYFGNGNAFACSEQWGDASCQSIQTCSISGIPPGYPRSNPGYGDATGVSLEQTVSGLAIGQIYVLEFWAGGEPLQGLLSLPGIFAVDVGFGKTYLLCQPTGEPGFLTGTRYLLEFMANATSHKIKFTNWGHTCDVCTELVLDDVSLYTIEELSGTVQECTTATHEEKSTEDIRVYPNPFHEKTTIQFELDQAYDISLQIHDMTGHKMETLFQDHRQPGMYQINWHSGNQPSGIYYYQFTIGNHIRTGKLVSMK